MINSPESFPEIFIPQRHFRISGNNRIQIRPILPPLHATPPNRVVQDVSNQLLKGVLLPVFLTKHMIMRLLLPLESTFAKPSVGVFPQESDQRPLMTRFLSAQHEQMNMIPHKAIRRTNRAISPKRMKQNLPELAVKRIAQPPGPPFLHCKRPMDKHPSHIERVLQSREMRSPRSLIHAAILSGRDKLASTGALRSRLRQKVVSLFSRASQSHTLRRERLQGVATPREHRLDMPEGSASLRGDISFRVSAERNRGGSARHDNKPCHQTLPGCQSCPLRIRS